MCDAECEGRNGVDLVPENLLVVGSSCVRVLNMQCVTMFRCCKRGHCNGVICCKGLTGAYLELSSNNITVSQQL